MLSQYIKNLFGFLLLTTSCTIEQIPRQPLLATPLGLQVKTAPAIGGGVGLGLFFTANNPEIYFSGFSIYVSTREEDFKSFLVDTSGTNVFFPLNPLQVPGTQARLLTNYTPINDTNVSIWIGGKMAFPERRFYPPPPSQLILDNSPNIPETNPEFTLTSFSSLPPALGQTSGEPFVSGTTYYFAVYAYSSINSAFSLPSNIGSIVFP
ncbi:MAG: hypothetical protein ACRCWI_03315 [Brevinema sp.]